MSAAVSGAVSNPVLADLHIHTEWSWDAPRGAMEESCRRALYEGLKVVAFTEHSDHSALAAGAQLELAGYLEAVAHCRRAFPSLSVLSGVELGEPHRFPAEASTLLGQGQFDLVLGSLHSVISDDSVLELSELEGVPDLDPSQMMRAYFAELIQLIQGPVRFEVLTHLEYPKRFWLPQWPPYRSEEFQPEIRAVLETAARQEVVLELNTSRGGEPDWALCPSPLVIGWWRESGGRRLSVGSDAHDPTTIAAGFQLAGEVAAAAGFAPSTARFGMWSSGP